MALASSRLTASPYTSAEMIDSHNRRRTARLTPGAFQGGPQVGWFPHARNHPELPESSGGAEQGGYRVSFARPQPFPAAHGDHLRESGVFAG